MKTLVTLLLTVGILVPLAACSKTVVHEDSSPSPTIVREKDTVIQERSSPTVTEREYRY